VIRQHIKFRFLPFIAFLSRKPLPEILLRHTLESGEASEVTRSSTAKDTAEFVEHVESPRFGALICLVLSLAPSWQGYNTCSGAVEDNGQVKAPNEQARSLMRTRTSWSFDEVA
jgi:hypothetical protein